ncbi:MAG TPA: sugar phosphate nucleotidyltransferase [Polyangia bacterium]|jgi:NDP-sugar pyrophosphorylase family protein
MPTLLVLAAGMGSRYAGLKQIEGFGPSGETIMDYSIHDALAAGFDKVVFVIRRDFEAAFRAATGAQVSRRVAVDYVFQQLDDLPPGFAVTPGRSKPWGTAHAVWCARRAIAGPFVSINADDYYGKQAFQELAAELARPAAGGPPAYAMVGYPILGTLSDHAAVTRGICEVDAAGDLQAIVERMKVERTPAGARTLDETGAAQALTGREVVSMNIWGFTPAVFPMLERHLAQFLEEQRRAPSNAECLLPVVVGELLREKAARVRVLPTSDAWFGVTHPEDKPTVMRTLREMVARGDYPSPIWTETR